MTYTKTNWVNDGVPAINATNLNNIEEGIYQAHEEIEKIKSEGVSGDTLPIGAIVTYDGDTIPDGYEEVEDENTYSTEEHETGTWIDGKPVYRKVISTIASVESNIVLSINTDIRDAEMLWIDRENSYIYNNNSTVSEGRTCFPLPFNIAPNETSTYIGICLNGTNIELLSNGGWNNLWTKVITLKYTKVTD